MASRSLPFYLICYHPAVLLFLIIVNAAGTVYGYYWYAAQLASSPWYFWPVIPDSPTSSLFFTAALVCFWRRERAPLLEAFAALLSLKYGIWAVAIILFFARQTGVMTGIDWMLSLSHLGMAAEAILFLPRYSFKGKEIMLAGGWLLLNDVLDYAFDVHPWLPDDTYHWLIGGLTMSESLLVILFFAAARLWLEKSKKSVLR